MLPKTQRITKALFDEIYKKGRICHSAFFTLRVLDTHTTRLSRFSVVVGKKVERGAVGRNRLRRRGYAILRTLPTKDGMLGIVMPKKEVIELTFGEYKEALMEVLKKANLFQEKKVI